MVTILTLYVCVMWVSNFVFLLNFLSNRWFERDTSFFYEDSTKWSTTKITSRFNVCLHKRNWDVYQNFTSLSTVFEYKRYWHAVWTKVKDHKISTFDKNYNFVSTLRCVKYGNEPIEYLVLEDLSARGYNVASRFKGLDMDHVKMILKKLAYFHAVSACYYEDVRYCLN